MVGIAGQLLERRDVCYDGVTTVGIGDKYQDGKTGGCLVRDSYRRPGRKFLIHISALIFLILEYTYV